MQIQLCQNNTDNVIEININLLGSYDTLLDLISFSTRKILYLTNELQLIS